MATNNAETQGGTGNVEVNTFLDTLKSKGITDQTVLGQLDSLKKDPDQLHRLPFQEGLLDEIIKLDPATNPNINPQQAEELRLYLQAAHHLEMDKIKGVGEYFGKIKLPRPPKEPKSFSRRAFAGGVFAGLAGSIFGPRAINALITPSVKPDDNPTGSVLPEPIEVAPPTPAAVATNAPLEARPTLTTPAKSTTPAESKPTVTTQSEPKPTNPPLPTKPSPTLPPPVPSPKPPDAKPTIRPTPEPTKSAELESSIISEILISRLQDEAAKRRTERRSKNPQEYDKRVNSMLNKNRINIVLFGYGAMKWYEASGAQSTQAFRGSQSILSIDTLTGKIDVITPTGQTMAPEVRKYQLEHGQKDAKFDWVDKAYHTGGFDLQRLVIEDMTGLSADFQVVLQDSAIKSLVDQVFQGLKMNVPADLETMPFMLDNTEYPQGKFSKGEHVLNGVEVVQYIKALAKSFVDGTWILDAEPNPRKHQIFRNMMKAFEENKLNLPFWFRLKSFVDENSAQKKVAMDFDVASMITSALSPGAAFSMIGKKIEGKQPPSKLTINKTIFMQDPNTGADGGVSWIQASTSPYIKKAIQEGLVADPHDSVPYTPNANPFSENLVDNYWKSTRELVEKKLTS